VGFGPRIDDWELIPEELAALRIVSAVGMLSS
jgi:hypothetical protein